MQIYYRWRIKDGIKWCETPEWESWRMTIYFQRGFEVSGEDGGVTCEWQQVMCWCVHSPPCCACWLLMAADSLASQPGRQPSWHHQSHSQTWRCTPAVQPAPFKLMMPLFKAVMSLWRLFVSLLPFPWSLHPCFCQSRGHLYPAWERQEEPSHLRPVYHFKVCVWAETQKLRWIHKHTHGAKHPTISANSKGNFFLKKDMKSGQFRLVVIHAAWVCLWIPPCLLSAWPFLEES